MRAMRAVLPRLVCLVSLAAAAVFAGAAAAQTLPGLQPVQTGPEASPSTREAIPSVDGAGEKWNVAFGGAYGRLLALAPYRPSGLALRVAVAEGGRRLGHLPPEGAAALALSCALEVERDLRFGASPQEARAFIRLYLRSTASAADRSFAEAYGRGFARGSGAFEQLRRPGAGMGPETGMGPAMGGGGRGRSEE
ncbi:MAG: hypothetical protein M0Z80_04410 [Treponema sp.]|nr:hypothetical protein [Treponema sp.]